MDVTATETIAANVRREMRARAWTQTDLAREAGVTQPQVSDIISGDIDHRISKLEKVAKAFGVTLSALLMPVADKKV